MKITIESTNEITTYNERPARVWNGKTERGIECKLFIAGVAVHNDLEDGEFQRELSETRPPKEVKVVDLRQVL